MIAAIVDGVDGAVPGVPLHDTIKIVDDAGVVQETPERTSLVAVQTPQAFRAAALRAAHVTGAEGTDDASLVEANGGKVVVVTVSRTTARSRTLTICRGLGLSSWLRIAAARAGEESIRVGQGFDVHRHTDDAERVLVLGGCRFEGERGLGGPQRRRCPGATRPRTPSWARPGSVISGSTSPTPILVGKCRFAPDLVRSCRSRQTSWVVDRERRRQGRVRTPEARRAEGRDGTQSDGCRRGTGDGLRSPCRRARRARSPRGHRRARRCGRRDQGLAIVSSRPKRGPGQGRGGRAAAGRKSGPPRSRAPAVRAPPVARETPKPGRSQKGLGGEQVEGRQAVRELLLAQRRKVHEIWISSELQGDRAVEDIETIAAANRVPITYVARKRLEATARSEAPQGVLAMAAPLQEADLGQFVRRRGRSPRSWSPWTGSPTRATSARSCAAAMGPASTSSSCRGTGPFT